MQTPALLCFSHLRWDFVFQRPQHLMTRWARDRRVFFVEEPTFGSERDHLDFSPRDGVNVVVPRLAVKDSRSVDARLRSLVDAWLASERIDDFIAWYYTPMALEFTHHLRPRATVYDCMDELSAFLHAPRELVTQEHELFLRADVVFTGGRSLYLGKRDRHPRVHCFPSSIDRHHFGAARTLAAPDELTALGGPRLGFFGVIDERMDLALIDALATSRPDWQLIMIGPVVKIDPATLPRRANIHWLGARPYAELPRMLAGFDVALLPFALNAATRFISPTKTPEYLAGGKPVVSSALEDVVRPYGERGMVAIAGDPVEWVEAIDRLLAAPRERWLADVDAFLAQTSWDATFERMRALVEPPAAPKHDVQYAAAP